MVHGTFGRVHSNDDIVLSSGAGWLTVGLLQRGSHDN